MATRRAKSEQRSATGPSQRLREAAAEIYRVVRAVTLDEITVLDEVQVREGLDEEHVERLAELLLGGGAYKDPIMLFEEDDGSRRILADGWHRREGYRQALERFAPTEEVPELAPLLAEIRPGGLNAAIEYAEEANLTHGKHLTQQDKRNVAFRRWARGHEWLWLSNRALAAKLGVSHMTISNWRREFEESSGKNFPDTPQKRLVKRGDQVYEQDASGIQEANQRRVEETGKTAQANARMAERRDELIDAVLAVVSGKPPMTWREIEFAVNAHIGRIANSGLLSGAITAAKQKGLLRFNPADGRYVLPDAAPAELSDNGYQMDEPEAEPDGAWLEQALQRGEPVPHQHDEDLAAKLNELLRVGEMVAGHLEMVLERAEPLPEWLLVKLNELQGLLYGHAGRDADIYDPGLTTLMDELYAKHFSEKGSGK